MLDFLVQRFAAVPESEWRRRIAAQDVVDEFGVPVTPARRYQAHVRLYYYRCIAQEPRIPFDEVLLFQDEHLVVADKPHFLPVTAGGRYVQEALQVRLKRRLKIDALQPIHRIDRETAGVVVFCVQPQERDAYHALFRQHAVQKTYQAIAPWNAAHVFPQTRHSRIVQGEPFFRQCEADGTPNALTEVDVIEVQGERARYRLSPHTGQKHQLRVHMAALGLALENDPFYPEVRRGNDEPDDWSRPLQLLGKSIAFVDPVTGQPRHFESQQELRL
jgi:tRNA pseudouridine32 synthase/23S rRNA pseudouridine746 synthase